MKSKSSWILIALLALVAGSWAGVQIINRAPAVKAVYYQPAKVLPEFELVRDSGTFTAQDLLGRWSVVFIGYTFCPDICPTTLADLNRIYPQLKQNPADAEVQVIFLSVDPNRDTPENLTEYTHYFNSEFVGVTAAHEVLFPLTRALGMVYSIVEEGTEGAYLVDHSASIALLNPEGKLQAVFRPEFEPGSIPSVDMEQLVSDFYVISDR